MFFNLEDAMRHLVSFVSSPVGHVLNFLATLLCHIERLPGCASVAGFVGERVLCPACELLCARDGTQDDMLF